MRVGLLLGFGVARVWLPFALVFCWLCLWGGSVSFSGSCARCWVSFGGCSCRVSGVFAGLLGGCLRVWLAGLRLRCFGCFVLLPAGFVVVGGLI